MARMPMDVDISNLAHFSPHAQAVLRGGYGVLLGATLLAAVPQAPRFFTTARWGGYLDSSPVRDRWLRPAMMPVLLACWLGCALLLIAGIATSTAAFVNLLLCYYFFVHTRWTSILRGMGAPGFMTFWLGACVFLLEFALHHDPSGSLRAASVLTCRVDFAAIMLCAGSYKAVAGYRTQDGMELGLVNPWWSYLPRFHRRLGADFPGFRLADHLAYMVQILAAIAMLIPFTRELGAAAIALSFLGILTQLRLGFLCEMVGLACVLFVTEGSSADRLVGSLVGTPLVATVGAPLPGISAVLVALVLGYLVLLPFAKGGLYLNFYGRRRLPGWLQVALERYTNAVGLIIWRVFTIDVVSFYADICTVEPSTGGVREYARPGSLDFSTRYRYLHVGEFICLASLFTTLRYHPSRPELFREKLLRYAASIPTPSGWLVRFKYVAIGKDQGEFTFVPAAEFDVDVGSGTVTERVLDPRIRLREAASVSPVHEGALPGTYAPPPVTDHCRNG